jgi:hypothetical protein
MEGTCVGSRDGINSFDLPVALMAGTLKSIVFNNTLIKPLNPLRQALVKIILGKLL